MEAKIYLIALLAIREDKTFDLCPGMIISAGSIDEVKEEARSFALETYSEGGEWVWSEACVSQAFSITDLMQKAVDEEMRSREAEGARG